MKWIIILSCLLLACFSGIFTTFTQISYSGDNVITVGPQPDAKDDPKFRDKVLYVIADLIKSERTAQVLAEQTGLNFNKDSLYPMVNMSVNDLYQRLEMTISGDDPDKVKLVAEQLPNALSTTANEVFGITNLKVQNNQVALKSTSKPYKRNLLAGAVGGAGIGFLIIFVMLLFDDRFKDRQGVKRIYQIDELGDKNLSLSPTKVLLKARRNSARVITNLYTGEPCPEHLASMTQYIGALGKKVLIIDLVPQNMEKPLKGVSDLLEEKPSDVKAALESLIQPMKEQNLFLLPAGTKEISFPALYDRALHQLFASADFDMIFISTGTQLGLDKLMLVTESSDAVILAFEEKTLTVSHTHEVMDTLKEMNTKILGYYMV